jgi:hypothetical protein
MRGHAAALDVATIYGANETYQSIYGNLVAQWHRSDRIALSGAAITAWQDSISKLSLPAAGVPNRPTMAVSGSFWRGQAIPKFSVSGASGINNNGGSALTLCASGTRPYFACAVRFTGVAAGTQYCWYAYNTAVNIEVLTLVKVAGNVVTSGHPGPTSPAWTPDNNVHWHEVLYDASGVRVHAVDGVTIGTFGTGGTTQTECAVFAFGTPSFPCDFEIGVHLIAPSAPTAAARARGLAFAKQDLGF